jgi:uncharacterized protein with PIN domain
VSDTNEILERIASGIEKLGEDPVIQVETAPPVCPHCETINPVVSVEESGGTGPLSEFVIRCVCQKCKRVFYALPIQWTCVSEMRQLEQIVAQHKELSGYGSNGNSDVEHG